MRDTNSYVSKPKSAGQKAVQATAAAKAANNYKQGISSGKPANTWGAAPASNPSRPSGPASPNYGGKGNTAKIYAQQMSGDAPLGYTPGGFDDPSIDWQAIYNTFIAPQQTSTAEPAVSSAPTSYTPPAPPAPAPPPAIFQSPSSYSPPAVTQTPEVVATSVGGNGPEGVNYDALGTGMTGGMYDRRRNQRSPRSDMSVTPEMLRRAAQSRLG